MLTAANFDSQVLQSKDIWFVEFYAPWCGHCKSLEPEWNEAAAALKGKVRLAKVDATQEQQLAQRFGIQGYPSIKIFDYGLPKSDKKARDYSGGRNAGGIIGEASSLFEKADIDPDVYEVSTQGVYDETCKGVKLCVLNFLPNIYDSNAKERTKYIKLIKQVAKKNVKHPFVFYWLQAGDQLDMER